MIIIGKRCPVCRPNLYPLGWTRRHAKIGECQCNKQKGAHPIYHDERITIASRICFARKIFDLQISPFFNHDLHNFNIFWGLNFALIDL
jgi:hypothetical protein